MTARYMPTYRPRSPWRDISNDAVSDSGSDILGWREAADWIRSEEHTSELQSLMRISYAVFCLKKKTSTIRQHATLQYKRTTTQLPSIHSSPYSSHQQPHND